MPQLSLLMSMVVIVSTLDDQWSVIHFSLFHFLLSDSSFSNFFCLVSFGIFVFGLVP